MNPDTDDRGGEGIELAAIDEPSWILGTAGVWRKKFPNNFQRIPVGSGCRIAPTSAMSRFFLLSTRSSNSWGRKTN